MENVDERDVIETLRSLHEHHSQQQQEPRQNEEGFSGIDAETHSLSLSLSLRLSYYHLNSNKKKKKEKLCRRHTDAMDSDNVSPKKHFLTKVRQITVEQAVHVQLPALSTAIPEKRLSSSPVEVRLALFCSIAWYDSTWAFL